MFEQRCLSRHLAAKRKKNTQEALDEHTPSWQATRSLKRSPKLERLQQARREERLALYQHVMVLRKKGMSQAAIAERVGIGQSTVGNWLAAGTFPERKPREQACRLDPYLPYI
ncbi:MAG TPA: helix-turn-helix domain-containing protein, partial [Ktedonobacteraceae bacterium]|nr:helix-turn-helix domain-containing protein [Ktedonobacteraceae bacterium]